ncbi:MAG: amidophosphoribosyltransferase [Myxococcales bacterium]|nr:amidophosphoribosyltransferase [Myxococcales bacterium]MCB9713729.1 amidophosphoribosyltransferase [Myxococcales bacterium]
MCGVFGIWRHPEAANLSYLGLHALQHRGQESAGVVSNDGGILHAMRSMGHVRKIFTREALGHLPGDIAIGHVRYTTAGASIAKNIQPLWAQTQLGTIAVAHNGNLVNEEALRARLEADGAIFSSQSDTEVILQLMARSRAPDFVSQLMEALGQIRGAYSLVLTTEDKLIAVRDPHGFRPLVLGRLPSYPGTWIVASETSAFDLLEATRVRDLEPGEILVIDGQGLTSRRMAPAPRRLCVFEHVYFARPDSLLDGQSVYEARIAMGEQLAVEHPVDADAVIPVPDSGVVAAMGYARRSGIPFEMGLIRNHYVGRTFIEPSDSIRHFGVRLKLNAVPHLLHDKRVIVVDDSLVRGTTSRKIVRLIRQAGAREVHVRISSPPVSGPCYYGIDTPTRAELVASTQSVDQIRAAIEADSLGYLSPDGLLRAVQADPQRTFCDACFTGEYPVPIDAEPTPRQLRLIEL